jgi:DNA-binding transcriptional MocR family regulator
MGIDWEQRFSAYGKHATASEIRELLKVLDRPGIISFAGGIPDPSLFPTRLIAEAHRHVLEDRARAGAGLQYSVSEGFAPLRQWLSGYMRMKGVVCGIDNILITTGSQQGIYLTGRLILDPGDGVLTARPTYLGVLQAFGGTAPRYGTLAVLTGGEAFDAKLAYAMPDFANPTGESFSLSERRMLIAGAQAKDVIVLEDAAYCDLRYSGEPRPSLMALDLEGCGSIENSRVIYTGTFSKTIVPGLRVGWVVAPTPVVRKLVLLKQASDLHTSTLTQMVLTEVVSRLPQSHIAMLCENYGARRDAMLRALTLYMPPGVSWTKPEGGMFIWVTLPGGIDGAQLLAEAIGMGVAFVPGGAFFPDKRQHNALRLNFSLCDPDIIRDGIARLGQLITRKVKALSAGG